MSEAIKAKSWLKWCALALSFLTLVIVCVLICNRIGLNTIPFTNGKPSAPVISQNQPDLSGEWVFKAAESYSGTITLHQSGSSLNGTWHTVLGMRQPDSRLTGAVHGNVVDLTRTIEDKKQEYVLKISSDGNHVDGFGEGSGIRHGRLSLARIGSATDQ
jgi:hypothetical protein